MEKIGGIEKLQFKIYEYKSFLRTWFTFWEKSYFKYYFFVFPIAHLWIYSQITGTLHLMNNPNFWKKGHNWEMNPDYAVFEKL